MGFKVRIRHVEDTIAVRIGATILQSALDQGLAFPHECRNGTCGACKSRLHRGDVQMLPCSGGALTAGERDRGLILACRAIPWDDCEISWLGGDEAPARPVRRLECQVLSIEDATRDIRILRLAARSGDRFIFSAGQYASVVFQALPPRDFSMANRCDEEVLEFHVRRLEPGTVSAHVFERLRRGESVTVEGPYGSAWLRENHRGPILAVARGSGLAPVKSIVESALVRGMRQPIHLYFGVREERDLYLEEHFLRLARRHSNLRFIPVLSEPDARGSATRTRRTGPLGRAIAEDFAGFDEFKAYVCGPPAMVDAVQALLLARGLPPGDVHADAFHAAGDQAATPAAGSPGGSPPAQRVP